MSLQLLLSYIDKKRAGLSKDKDGLDQLSKSSPGQKVSDGLGSTASTGVWDKLKKGPMGQLGQDFIAEQVSKNGSRLINNVEASISKKLKKPIEDAQALVFDSITAALTAQNDLSMFFLQQVAKQLLLAMDKKRAIAIKLQEKIRELHNILILITTSKPFFDEYLGQLRQALILIYDARNNLTVVRNTLQANDRWLKQRFAQSIETLKKAEELMQPDAPEPDVKFTNNGLLAGVGIPSKPQQIVLLMSLAQKTKEVLACATGYFTATLKVNVLILGFITGFESFQNSASRKLKQFTINTLDNIVASLDALINGMATQLNGSPTSILIPDTVQVSAINPNVIANASAGRSVGTTESGTFDTPVFTREFSPSPVATASSALGWVIELKTIIQYMTFIPGPTLEALDVSNDALARYNEAVTLIKTKNLRVEGDAILTALEGREEVGQLEKQITTFLLGAMKGIADPNAAKLVIPLGKTLIKRVDLTILQDQEIYAAVSSFATADLSFPGALKKVGDNIYKMLDKFGLDKAADALRNGDFTSFFNMDGKTATYAGAALTAFSVISECLQTTEEKEALIQARREVEREVKSKDLIGQRVAASGFQQQKEDLRTLDIKLETLSNKAVSASGKCGVPDDFLPGNLMKNLGPIVGISVLGNKSLQDSLTKLGRGII